MAAFEVQTNEVHLLLNSTLSGGNTFQLKPVRLDNRLEIASGPELVCTSDAVGIATVNNAGLITAVDFGETFIHVTYKDKEGAYNLIVKVQVHKDIVKTSGTSGKYLIYNGDNRITTYKSKAELNIFYIPTIYAKFVNAPTKPDTFGDISCHPYLAYEEKMVGGAALGPTDTHLLSFEMIASKYSGRFRCIEKGATTTGMQTHREIKVSLQETGTSTNTAVSVEVRCEDYLDAPKPVLTKISNEIIKKEEPITRVLILAEGYTDTSRFSKHCELLVKRMKELQPYNILKDSIEFWYAPCVSGEDGVTIASYVNVDNTNTEKPNLLVPGSLNYFKYPVAVKAAIAKIGISTGANDAAATSFYNDPANASAIAGVPNAGAFLADWKRSQLTGFVKNRDTRLCITLNKCRPADEPARSGEQSAGNSYWLKSTDYYETGIDRRKTTLEGEGIGMREPGFEFMSRFISSLTPKDTDQTITGSAWADLNRRPKVNADEAADNDDKKEKDIEPAPSYRRTYVAILINHPLGIGVNRGLFFTTTLGENNTLDLSSPVAGIGFTDGGGIGSSPIPMLKIATFIHEMTHFFNIGDEYEDTRGESHDQFTPSASGYSAVSNANIDSFDHIKLNETSPSDIDPSKIKWNWKRIRLSSAVISKPVINAQKKLEIQLASKADADKWQPLVGTTERVFVRTLNLAEIGAAGNNNYSVLGEHETGVLTVAEVTTTFLVKLNIDINFEALIQGKLDDHFLGEACIYTRQKGIYRIKDVLLVSGGSNFKPAENNKPLTRTLEVKGLKNSDMKIFVQLNINSSGECSQVTLLKDNDHKEGLKTIFLNDEQPKISWPTNWFGKGAHTPPVLDFKFEPYNTSLERIVVTDPGSGYTAPPVVTVVPALGGVVAEAVLSGDDSYVELDSAHTGGDMLFPLYLEAIDLRSNTELKQNERASGLKALVTELSPTGGILDFVIIDYGKGEYSDNPLKTKIIVKTKDQEYVKTSGKASLSLDHKAYKTEKEGKFLYDVSPVKKIRSAIKIDAAGSGYKMPRGPLVLSLSLWNEGGTPNIERGKPALVLCYLDSSKMVSKMEILYKGEGFEIGDKLSVAGNNISFWNLFNGLAMNKYRTRKKVYGASEDVKYEYIDEWPVFEVLAIEDPVSNPNFKKGITSLGFANDPTSGQPMKGKNLRYPTQGPTIRVCGDRGSYYDEYGGSYGEYDFEWKAGSDANSKKINKIILKKTANIVVPNKKIRLYGGQETVPEPAGAAGSTVMCDTNANTGGAKINVFQDLNVAAIIFKKVSGVEQRGLGYTTEPVIQIGPPQLPGGKQAKAAADLSFFPRLIDPTVMKYMSERKKPFIDWIAPPVPPSGSTQTSQELWLQKGHGDIKDAIQSISDSTVADNITIDPATPPDQLLAIFEGAATYNHLAYRPSFDSLMRNSGRYRDSTSLGFNFVTMYYVVNYLNASKLDELDTTEYFNTIKYTVKLS